MVWAMAIDPLIPPIDCGKAGYTDRSAVPNYIRLGRSIGVGRSC
jgi:hypothetical protein